MRNRNLHGITLTQTGDGVYTWTAPTGDRITITRVTKRAYGYSSGPIETVWWANDDNGRNWAAKRTLDATVKYLVNVSSPRRCG